jgi:outer membrane protein assembly factor BamB
MNKKLIGIVITMLLCATTVSVAVSKNITDITTNPQTTSTDNWSMWYHDAQRTGFSTSHGPATNATYWSAPYVFSSTSPIIVNGIIYVSTNYAVLRYNSATGMALGGFPSNTASQSSPAVSGNHIFIASDSNFLYCYNITTLLQEWSIDLGLMSALYAPIPVEQSVYQAYLDEDSGNSFIGGFNANTGAHLWADISIGGNLQSDIVVADAKIYFTFGQSLFCYDAMTGAPLWSTLILTGSDSFNNKVVPAVSNGKLFTISKNGVVYCLDLSMSGSTSWSYPTGDASNFGNTNHPSVAYGNVYVGTPMKLYCLNAATGASVWTYANGNTGLNPIVASGKVYVLIRLQGLKCLNAFGNGDGTTSLIWKYDAPSLRCPAIANGVLCYIGTDAMLYAFHAPNHTPNKPTITGPTDGLVGSPLTFTIGGTDPDNDSLTYSVGWNQFQEMEYFGPFPSGISFEATHTYNSASSYYIFVTSTDPEGATSQLASFLVTIRNAGPSIPTISGPRGGSIGVDYTYSATAIDSTNHTLSYNFSWGDGTSTGWSSYIPSGTPFSASHNWLVIGTFSLTVKVQDSFAHIINSSTISMTIADTTMTVENTIGVVGQTHHVTRVNGSWSYTIYRFLLTIHFDPNVIHCTDVTLGSVPQASSWWMIKSINNSAGTCFLEGHYSGYIGAPIPPSSGVIGVMTFDILNNAPIGPTYLNFTQAEFVLNTTFFPSVYPRVTNGIITIFTNSPPATPDKPTGPSSGFVHTLYTYTSKAIDPDSNQVFYNFTWGDGTSSGWFGPYPSGTSVSKNHMWNYTGTYDVTVQAKDSPWDTMSSWSQPLAVKIEVPVVILSIDSMTGGKGITAVITNNGNINATTVEWAFHIEGGLVVNPRDFSDLEARLGPGESATVTMVIKFGIGLGILKSKPVVTLTVICDEGPSAELSKNATILFKSVTFSGETVQIGSLLFSLIQHMRKNK